jgi:hypothetical protein
MLFGETVAVYSENHTEHTNTLCERNVGFSMLKQVVHLLTTGLKGVKGQLRTQNSRELM